MTQVALPAGCATCPTAPQCFPGIGGAGGGLSPIAFACPTQGFTQAGFQQPACPTGNNFAQPFSGGQQIALTTPGVAPPITRDAILPHGFRGVCSNCHQILGTPQNPQGVR